MAITNCRCDECGRTTLGELDDHNQIKHPIICARCASKMPEARVVSEPWYRRALAWRPRDSHAECISKAQLEQTVHAKLNEQTMLWWKHDSAQRTYIEQLQQQLRAAGIAPALEPYIHPVPTLIPGPGVPRFG